MKVEQKVVKDASLATDAMDAQLTCEDLINLTGTDAILQSAQHFSPQHCIMIYDEHNLYLQQFWD